jgi:hypothetical protein
MKTGRDWPVKATFRYLCFRNGDRSYGAALIKDVEIDMSSSQTGRGAGVATRLATRVCHSRLSFAARSSSKQSFLYIKVKSALRL